MNQRQYNTGNTKNARGNIEKMLQDLSIGNDFLSRTLIAQDIRAIIDKWPCLKLKSFCTVKETMNRVNRQIIEWEKIFGSYESNSRLITRIYKGFKKLNKRANIPLINGQFN
jgi:hypothetical protein